MRLFWLILFGLVFPAGSLLLATEAQDQAPAQEAVSKAVTLESADFLKLPAGIDAKSFAVAKTAPVVDVCEFADLKNHGKGTLWSSWGDGCVAANGKYYTSVGDHLGKDANSYVYEYNPMTRAMRRVVDVLRAIMHKLGLFGHGKIHSGIHQAADGKLYFTTYWGKQNEVEKAYANGYDGSVLLRYDPKTDKTENLGAIVPRQGLPASLFDADRQLLYFHTVYKNNIAVYDVKAQKVKYVGGSEVSSAPRTFMLDQQGRAYFSGKDDHLHYYDPDKNALAATKVSLPESGRATKKDGSLRAFAQRPAKNGLLYGMTAQGQVFAYDPKKQDVKDLGANFLDGDYTAAMVLSPDEKYLYYAPGAHGSGAKTGVPVVQLDIANGQRKVLAFLQGPLQEKLKYNIGGTYNVQIDPTGQRLFMTFNGADPSMRGVFGKPVVVVLHIPASER